MLIALACRPRQELDLPRRQAAHTSFLPADDRFLPNLAFMKQDLLGRQERMCPIAEGYHRASLRFLETLFEPTDWVAILLKSYESSRVAQHVGSVSEFRTERCLRWLHVMNARKYNVFVSVNSIVSGRRARTRDAIGTVRHVFLDADQDGLGVLSHIAARDDLPRPSYVLHSSPNHVHILWRAAGFDHASAECLQKHLARELRTDSAATAVTQMTRLPGFFNHKRAEPHLVTVEYYDANTSYAPEDFPAPAMLRPKNLRRPAAGRRAGRLTIERARRYLAAVPPAIAGQHGDIHTFRACCRLVRGFALTERQALDVLSDWNTQCLPPWSPEELLEKVRRAARYGREPVGGLL